MVTLRYADYVSMTPGVGDAAYVFRGNDTFDPNFTGTGAQPAYRDNYAAVYYLQQVVASAIRVKARNYDNSNSGSCIVCIAPVATTSGMTTLEAAQTCPGSRTFNLNYYSPIASGQSQASSNAILGIQPVRGQGIGTAAVSASPTANSVWYWMIIARAGTGASTTIYLDVEIDYRTLFSGRVPAALSLAHAAESKKAFEKAQAQKPQGPVFFELPRVKRPPPPKALVWPEEKVEKKEDLQIQADAPLPREEGLGAYELVEVYRKPAAVGTKAFGAGREETKSSRA